MTREALSSNSTPHAGSIPAVLRAVLLASVVTVVVSGCGSGSSGGSPPAATPAPTGTPPAITPTPVPAIAAMALAEHGVALSVNRDGWISWRDDTANTVIHYLSGVTWAPDVPRPSVPLPTTPCTGLPPEACIHQFDMVLEVGDDGWLFGDHVLFGSGGPFIPLPALFGPDRSTVLLIDPADPPLDLEMVTGFAAHLCARAQVTGGLTLRENGAVTPVRRPVLWASPTLPMLRLPSDDGGAVATSCDRARRVAGVADAPSRAVIWLPDAATDSSGYAQHLLPFDGADTSAALAIDVGQAVGWRRDAARSTAVAWLGDGDPFVASVLPDLPGAPCERATATSGTRIAGECGLHGVAWDRTQDGDGWHVVAELLPLPGDAQAGVVAMSGDLVVGWSGAGDEVVDKRPVAWRLPPQ